MSETPSQRPGCDGTNTHSKSARISENPVPAEAGSHDEVEYEDAVREARAILDSIESTRARLLRVGELAHRVKPKYGERTLWQFAIDVGIAGCTLERYRSVYRAWADIPEPAPESTSFAVLQVLQAHPKRFEIVKDQPNLTKREAGRLVREQHRAEVAARPADWRRSESKRWFAGAVRIANEAVRAASIEDSKPPPDQRRILREVVEPNLLSTLREGGEALIRLAHYLDSVLREKPLLQEEELLQEAQEPAELAEAAE